MASSNRASPQASLRFAGEVVRELSLRRPDAAVLQARTGHQGAVVGVNDDGEWVPLLKVVAGSAACNVMSLQVADKRRWAPTGLRGTAAQLAETLSSHYDYLWTIAVAASGFRHDG